MRNILWIGLCLLSARTFAQEDLDKLISIAASKNEKVTSTFKSGNLINLKTTKQFIAKKWILGSTIVLAISPEMLVV